MKKLIYLLFLISFNSFATPVNINKADAETIAQSLNGIGLKKAEAIIQYRK
ncbi:MAG: helix-hairpin-helix domain-containing protein, partial [Methylococcaceae bacterium]|nr:helix-hairpin-helix domain-containing protein [Methylococcaceae bacterium]